MPVSTVTSTVWRVYFNKYNGNANVRLSEIAFLDANRNAITGGTFTSLGRINGSDEQLHDGNAQQSIEFDIGENAVYVQCEFPTAVAVNGIRVTSSNDVDGTAMSMAPVNMQVNYGSSGVGTKLFRVAGNAWTAPSQSVTFMYSDGDGGDDGAGAGGGTVGPGTGTFTPPPAPGDTPKAKYWRVRATAQFPGYNGAGSIFAGRELILATDYDSSTQAAINGTAITGATRLYTTLDGVFDGNTGNLWQIGDNFDVDWLGYIFTDEVTINCVTYWANSNFTEAGQTMSKGNVDYSLDEGTTWVTYGTITFPTFTASGDSSQRANVIPLSSAIFTDPDYAGGDIIVSGYWSAANPPAAAFDRDTTTLWESQRGSLPNGEVWLGYHFSQPIDVKAVRYQLNKNFETTEWPTAAVIQYSDDGATWVDSFTPNITAWLSGGGLETQQWENPDSSDKTPHAYWRVKFTASSSNTFVHCTELFFLVSGVNVDFTLNYGIGNRPFALNVTFDYSIYGEPVRTPASKWRINIFANGGVPSNNCGFTEWRLYDNTGTNLAVDASKMTASNTSYGSIAGAVDNDYSTYWVMGGSTGWLEYDFDTPVTIYDIAISALTPISGYGDTIFPKDFNVEYWNGSAWAIAWMVRGATATDGTLQHFPAPALPLNPIYRNFYFNYNIAYTPETPHVDREVNFSYEILSASINKEFSFDYSVSSLRATFGFDYEIFVEVGVNATFVFDWQTLAPYVAQSVIRMPPETPIAETWAFSSNIIKSYDGTEQRSSIREFPSQSLELSYIVLNDADRAIFTQDFMQTIQGSVLVPQWQYAANVGALALSDIGVTYDVTKSDIRGGDYVYFVTPQGLTGFLAQVANIMPTGCRLTAPIVTSLPQNSWIMPARKMHLTDGDGISMKSIDGEVTIRADGLTYQSPMRAGQLPGLLDTYDGLVVLQARPLAPADEVFTGNDKLLALTQGVPAEVFYTWAMPATAGSRRFVSRRGAGLDYWREFAALVAGQRVPFLLPTFRKDFAVAARSPGVLTVRGQSHLRLAGFAAYSRLQIETELGTQNVTIIDAAANGDDTDLTLSDVIVGQNIKRVSYLNMVRLNKDTIKLTHDVQTVTVDIDIQVTN